MPKLRLLLADDHAVVREGLKLILNAQRDMEVVGEAEDGEAAWAQVQHLQPDVVVMDVSMPRMNGVEATLRLKQAQPGLKVLVLTMHEDESYLRQLLKAGASGCVLKRSAGQELTQAVRAVAAGGLYLDPTLANKVVDRYVEEPSVPGDAHAAPLSDREMEVLRLIAAGHSNKEIATQLRLSVKTVETYKARLMEKLALHSRAELVRYALHHGFLPRT